MLVDLIRALEIIDPEGVSATTDPDSDAGDQPRGPIIEEGCVKGIVLFQRFKLKEKVGEGGFGIVLRAYDRKLDRIVALKIPHPGRTFSKSDARRFFNDAYAPARLSHDNIVTVHDVGDLGLLGCYIVSEFCDGPNLRDWMKERGAPVPPRLAARILEELADAVQHAHENGIFHRDIKPDNILIVSRRDRSASGGESRASEPKRPADAVNDADVHPILVDFGMARISDGRAETSKSGRGLGTLGYSPPESVAGRRGQIGTWSDVYGLGATLYEMLVDREPFRGDSDAETIRLVMDADPVAPRSLRPAIPRDLETVCLKCLNKKPGDRLETAGELRDELRRFLNYEPTRTRPAPAWELAWKSAKRRPLAATMLGVAFLAVFSLIGGLVWRSSIIRRHAEELQNEVARANRLAQVAEENRRVAEEQRHIAEEQSRLSSRHSFAASLREATRALDDGKFELAQYVLHNVGSVPGINPSAEFAWQYLWRLARRDVSLLWGHSSEVFGLTISPDRRWLATSDAGGKVLIWDFESESRDPRLRLTLGFDSARSYHATFSNGPRPMLALVQAAENDGKWESEVRIVDLPSGHGRSVVVPEKNIEMRFVKDGKGLICCGTAGPDGAFRVRILDPRKGVVLSGGWEIEKLSTAPVFTPDGRSLAIFDHGRVRLRDSESGRILVTFKPDRLDSVSYAARLAVFSEDGNHAAMRRGNSLFICETVGGREIARIDAKSEITHFQLDQTGARVAILDKIGSATLHDWRSGKVHSLTQVEHDFRRIFYDSFMFSPDGCRLVTAINTVNTNGRAPSVWDTDTGLRLATFSGPQIATTTVISRDGRSLFGTSGRLPVIWRFDQGPEFDEISHSQDEVWAVAISPDGNQLVTGSDNERDKTTIALWDRETGTRLACWRGHTATVSAVAFSPDGKTVASGSLDAAHGNLILWNVASRHRRLMLDGHKGYVRSVSFSHDGRSLATASDDKTVRTWDVATGRPTATLGGHRNKVTGAVFSPDGRSLASVSLDMQAIIWDLASRKPHLNLNLSDEVRAIAYSPDGSLLATVCEDGRIVLWDPGRGERIRTMQGETDEIRCSAFSPDGKYLAAAGAGKVVRVWDVVSGQVLLSLTGHKAQINAIAFAPDGNLLVSADHAGVVRFWRADPP